MYNRLNKLNNVERNDRYIIESITISTCQSYAQCTKIKITINDVTENI